MENNFEEKVLNIVKYEIVDIINEVKKENEQENNTNAIQTLVKVNVRINLWCENAPTYINIEDDKVEQTIASAKASVIQAAKNEIASEIAKIAIDGKGDVTERIHNYLVELNNLGIDLGNDQLKGKELLKEKKTEKNKTLAYDLLNSTPISPRRKKVIEDDCDSYGSSCGSSGCGGGGC